MTKTRTPGIWAKLFIAAAVALVAGGITLKISYDWTGHTPRELMDHVERRLIGHPKLECVALPVIGILREWLNEPALSERLQQPFVVPPPPSLNLSKVGEVTAPSGTGIDTPRILRVGKWPAIRTVAEAARLARDGDIVEIEAGEYRGDVALWNQKKLTIRGIGGNARFFADGNAAEGKAIWVIRNGEFSISNIDFIGATVSDLNGAGIRFENGHLIVKNCLFWNSDNGILTGSGKSHQSARLEIENSEFGYNGNGDGYSHNLYVGTIKSLRVIGSYFHHANVGHLLKSRAAHNEIKYNRITDESGGRASYELDLPNGGVAVVVGNIIQQNRDTENSTMISYGREGWIWPKNQLFLASNTLVNEQPYGGAFLRAAEGADTLISLNNLFIGKGKYHAPKNTQSMNDNPAEWNNFEKASRLNYHPNITTNKLTYQKPDPNILNQADLIPTHQYEHPHHTKLLEKAPDNPGAFQLP